MEDLCPEIIKVCHDTTGGNIREHSIGDEEDSSRGSNIVMEPKLYSKFVSKLNLTTVSVPCHAGAES